MTYQKFVKKSYTSLSDHCNPVPAPGRVIQSEPLLNILVDDRIDQSEQINDFR